MATPGEVGQASESMALLWQTTDAACVESIEEFPKMANSEMSPERQHAIHVKIANGRDGWVYFIDGGELIKIGWSSNPRRRLKTLSHTSPVKLRLLTGLPGNAITEGGLHSRFKADRRHGEWFAKSAELLAHIAEILERNGPTPWIKKRGPRKPPEEEVPTFPPPMPYEDFERHWLTIPPQDSPLWSVGVNP